MPFLAVRTTGFRNLVDADVATTGRDIFLIGENGQGKTNFLEALYYCSYASSFRGVKDTELIAKGQNACSVSARIEGSGSNRIAIQWENNKKTVTVDKKAVEDRKELLSVIPSIVFCHEDMEFVAGPPERRRWFFDQSQSLYDPLYLDDLRRYKKILKTRNTLIREKNTGMLDVVDPQIAAYGLELIKKRQQEARLFSELFEPLYEVVSGITGIRVRYNPSWKDTNQEALVEFLKNRREQDLSFGTSLSGPHRDRYSFIRDDNDFSGKASTGQRRLLALLLRIAQARRYSQVSGCKPVLLLDDVLLELDPEKRRRFVSVMPDYDQAFFTFLPEEPYERYRKPDTLVYHVREGSIGT